MIYTKNDNYTIPYLEAVNEMQGFNPKVGFILGTGYRYSCKGEDFSSNFCLDKLGKIDYKKLDKEYVSKIIDAYKKIRFIKNNPEIFTIENLPNLGPEYYPNMNNKLDSPYRKIKEEVAEKIKDITLFSYVGPKHRKIGFDNGIKKWTDKRCTAKNLGINGAVLGPIVDTLLEVNRSTTKDFIPDF